MSDLIKKRKDERIQKEILRRIKDNSQNLAKGSLDKDVMRVKGKVDVPDMNQKVATIPGVTEKINTRDSYDTHTSGESFRDKIERLRKNKTVNAVAEGVEDVGDALANKTGILKKIAKTGLKSVPLLGGIYSAIDSGDASAAIPLLGDSEGTGPARGSIDERLESGTLTEEDKKELIRRRQELFGK